MKTRRFILATLVVAMAATIAFVSCKKESQDAMLNNTQPAKTFTVPQVDDMNAYLKDFRQRMQASKDGETLALDEAAWHLSCLANVDFCRVNVEYDDFQFDTIEMQVNVTNGVMLMSDFCTTYEQMCTEIQQYKKGFNHLDQNLYFIKVSIGAEGNAKIALMTSYIICSKDLYTHQWYFPDAYAAALACDTLFFDDSTYVWDGLGASELQRVLNLYEHHENGPTTPGGPIAVCYIPTRDHFFNYTNTYDPYESGYYYINESRVFAKRYQQKPFPNFDYTFDDVEMCYLFDSCLGLGYDYISDHLYAHEFPVSWTITPITIYYNNAPIYHYYYYHDLHVEYGRALYVDD